MEPLEEEHFLSPFVQWRKTARPVQPKALKQPGTLAAFHTAHHASTNPLCLTPQLSITVFLQLDGASNSRRP